MKKYLAIAVSIIISSIILGSVAAAISERQFTVNEVDFKIVINGEDCEFSQPIITIDDRTYLPAREFCENIGYDIDWDGNKQVVSMTKKIVFKDDVVNSREGLLESGRRYFFYGTDNPNGSDIGLNAYLRQMKFRYETVYDVIILEETIEGMAEKVEELFFTNWPEKVELNIIYFPDANALSFIRKPGDVIFLGGLSTIIVDCESGVVKKYSDGMV